MASSLAQQPVGHAPTTPPRRRGVIQRFPATVFVLAPYVGLILPIAIIKHNPELPFIFTMLGLALVGCLVADVGARVLRLHPKTNTERVNPVDLKTLTNIVFIIAVGTRVLYTLAGGGTLAAQLARTHSSLTTPLSLFDSWNLFAVALLFSSYMRAACTRRFFTRRLTILVVVELWAALETTRTAPLQQFLTTVLLMALVLGLIRLRTLVIALVIVLLGWPTIFALRNTTRVTLGSTAYDQQVGAWDRLRLDLQLSRVAKFHVPVDLGQPGAFDVLRFGLIPRVLDSGRQEISSASLINQRLGGSATSSYNFLSIGTIYFFYGRLGLLAYYLFAGLLFTLLVGCAIRAGPLALCTAVLAASYLMGAASTFPDIVIGYLQALVSFVPILIAILAITRRLRREEEDQAERAGRTD